MRPRNRWRRRRQLGVTVFLVLVVSDFVSFVAVVELATLLFGFFTLLVFRVFLRWNGDDDDDGDDDDNVSDDGDANVNGRFEEEVQQTEEREEGDNGQEDKKE